MVSGKLFGLLNLGYYRVVLHLQKLLDKGYVDFFDEKSSVLSTVAGKFPEGSMSSEFS